jgi:hypothetical protein
MAYRTIIVGARTQYAVKVSSEDYDFLMQWLWTYAVSHPRHGGLVYARRCVTLEGIKTTILMHRVVLIERMGIPRPSAKHFVDHENGHALDNRRINDRGRAQLRWLTPKENMAARVRQVSVHAVPLPPEAMAVPF